MRTYRTRQNVEVKLFDEEPDTLWYAIKPGVIFVVGCLLAYALAVAVML